MVIARWAHVWKKTLIVILVLLALMAGLNKTAAEMQRVTAATPGVAMGYTISNDNVTILLLGKSYHIELTEKFKEKAVKVCEAGSQDLVAAMEYLRYAAGKLIGLLQDFRTRYLI